MVVWIVGVLLFGLPPLVGAAYLFRCGQLEYRCDRVPILLYHRLISKAAVARGDVRDDEMIWVSYDTSFEEQMEYLRSAGYTTIDLDDYLAIRAGHQPMPARPVIVTFDDGYESNYRFAFPVLRQRNQKATIFVAPEPDEHTRCLVEGIDGFLSDVQMAEMAEGGMSIQSHTLTHCILSELSDAQVLHELSASRERLERATGRAVCHLAIPRSGYSRRVRQLAKQTGYRTVCGNNKGSACLSTDLLGLPRIVVERDMTVQDFAAILKPRTSLVLRLVGNIKRIPERIGGGRFAKDVRSLLYNSPLKPIFKTRNLKRVLAAAVAVYGLACAGFWTYFLSH